MNKLNFMILALVGACSPYSPDLGNAPYLCAMQEPFCPDGYICQTTLEPAPRDRICVSGSGLQVDASGGGFPCANDSNLEGPSLNNTPQTAYQTPVDTMPMIKLADLAICPAMDKDHYGISLNGPNKGIEIIVEWFSGQPLSMSMLNQGGTAIVNGTAMGDKALRACAANLTSAGTPNGMFYAAVFASGMTQNNYSLTIKVVSACQ